MIAALAGLADLLVRRTVPATPRLCDGCGATVTRLTPAQCAQVGSDLLATCRRRGCDGRLYPVWPDAYRDTFVRVLSAEETRLMQNGALAATRTPPTSADHLEGTPAMTIISRHARELHAGDVIVHDPDHNRPVRWRVQRPPARAGNGEYAIAAVTDLADGKPRYVYYRALQKLSVEPVGGAA